MPSHYFTPRPDGPAAFSTFPLRFRDRTYSWVSAAGVFSRDHFDFGSRALLETAELPTQGRLLDLGCGTGALGLLAAVESPGLWVCLADINERALECARRNRDGLELAGRAAIVQGSFVDPFRSGRFDAIVFNPPIRLGKAPILAAFERLPAALAPGGRLFVVARVQQGARSLLAHLERVFEGRACVAGRRKGYLVLRADVPGVDSKGAAHPDLRAAGSTFPGAPQRPPETAK